MAEQPRCAECHRPLSDPESIRRGVGPVCWAKLQNERGVTIPQETIKVPSKRKYRSAQLAKLAKKLEGVNQRLDQFFIPQETTEREIEELLAQDREKELPIKKGVFSEV